MLYAYGVRVMLALAGAMSLAGCHATTRPLARVEPVAPAMVAPAASPAPPRAPASDAPLSPAEIAGRAMPSVALIKMPGSLGSGFVVSQDGKIATNLHVIRGATEATIVLADGREFAEIEVIGVDADHDLALLRVPQSGLPALPLGDSAAVQPGQHVVAIGNPLGFGNTVSDGLVSAVRTIEPGFTVLQISAPISAGSSGGPLLDEHGRVIGVSFLMATRGQNLNFGVPIAYLRPLLAIEKSVPLATFGKKPVRHALRRREIPVHEVVELRGCRDNVLELAMSTIAGAISVGAPLYNDGNHEACYRIYEGAALELEKKVRACGAVKKAMAAGRKRAEGLAHWDDKAWAMRDAFDGLADVIKRRLMP